LAFIIRRWASLLLGISSRTMVSRYSTLDGGILGSRVQSPRTIALPPTRIPPAGVEYLGSSSLSRRDRFLPGSLHIAPAFCPTRGMKTQPRRKMIYRPSRMLEGLEGTGILVGGRPRAIAIGPPLYILPRAGGSTAPRWQASYDGTVRPSNMVKPRPGLGSRRLKAIVS
jgi:hypothetical protein